MARFAIPAAAAAAIVLILAIPQGPDATRESFRTPLLPPVTIEGAPPHRAPTIVLGSAPVPASPLGPVSAAHELRWAAVDGADRYRVTVFDANGNVVYETELDALAAVLPDSVRLGHGEPYLWKVEARIEFDRWTQSDLVEFEIVASHRP